MKQEFNNFPKLKGLQLAISKTNSINISEIEVSAYKKFLYLLKHYPILLAVPTKAIDKVLHFHIENSELFKQDCLDYVGYKLIHTESKSKNELAKLKSNYKLTNQFWKLNFNSLMGKHSEMAFCGLSGDDSPGSDTDDTDTGNDNDD